MESPLIDGEDGGSDEDLENVIGHEPVSPDQPGEDERELANLRQGADALAALDQAQAAGAEEDPREKQAGFYSLCENSSVMSA